MTRFIRERARRLGFNHVGIAQASRLSPEGNRLQEWLERDFHATMVWMNGRAEERRDLNRYFPEARSIVSLTLNYFHGHSHGELRISNYAWGDDYHQVMKTRISDLLTEIQRIRPEVRGVVCVDTSPVMEKAWARRAGIGWIGKHTNLITRDYGSWLFLGELILDCDLDYDSMFDDDLCGTCTACIEACPTGAIVEEYILDANRCISYLTIEHRDQLPDQMADQLDGWIYGCDVCQEVCPWNSRFAKTSSESSFAPREEITSRTAKEWREMTAEDFRRSFENSAVKRAKFDGLKRNIKANLK
ncbi:MAG: tRNA epoxyqueuosine(34) reductase QueG [Candidatus Neomarinimicrobiota bacterium]